MPLDPSPRTAAETVLADAAAKLAAARARGRGLGFPAAFDIDYGPVQQLLGGGPVLNNLGDPSIDGTYPFHTKHLERDVITTIADLLRAPADDRWGYVTSGSTEGIEHALHLARRRFPQAMVYTTRAAHHSVTGAIDRLDLEHVTTATDESGEIDYADLAGALTQYRHRPAIIVANIGSALTEAVDDVRRIAEVCDTLGVRRWIHADGALTGLPLALMPPDGRPGFDFVDGADSINVSGHKFLGTPVPCGVILVRDSLRHQHRPAGTYTGSPDTTLTNSRSGYAAACLWYALTTHGTDGLRQRAEQARTIAAYAHGRLVQLGLPAHRHPWGFTVSFDHPGDAIAARWGLPTHTGPGGHARTHLITMPGVTRDHTDELTDNLRGYTPAHHHTDPPPVVPAPRASRHPNRVPAAVAVLMTLARLLVVKHTTRRRRTGGPS